ncbi:hypothetical protein A5658_09735 [Mycobacterium sp. 1245111.1]|uniref:hypothetical protein n=1 Tax=Mycobacterium sp. 1245111.1 TaxID=1834073 RepID=UPI000801F51E|nr:hypothetical protein [Mycobacterium sp. 1245111.1]OBK35116.1 hypothetical protein A5658_09735 [Mycobacterium sp. 1245111.1]
MGKHSIETREKFSSSSLLDPRLRLAASQVTSMASRRRRIGVAAGGLLGMALLPFAVAHADEWAVSPAPGSHETVTGIYGHGFEGGDTAPPAVEGSIQGDQTFDWTNVTASNSGTFYGYESYSNDGLGGINTEVYVASDVTGNGGPAVGSVFDTYSFGYGTYVNTYSAIPNGEGGSTITDTLQTPTGTIVVPTTFDAANGLIADAGGVGTGNGGTLIPVGSQEVTSISGIPPLTVALQGTQDFNFLNSAGHVIGTVGTVNTMTTDTATTYTEAVLVTNDLSGTVGNTAADVPAVGSIFNTIQFGGLTNVYSDYVSPGGNHYLDTLYTPLGNYVIPIAFDAARVESLSNSSVTLPSGMVFDPTTELTFTGINGLPPVDVGVQGGQDFSFTDGATTGTFTADVTNTLDEFNDSTETILVTSSSDAASLPVGSEFEIVNFGYGFESIYSDLAGSTATETLVTPFGDISVPPAFDMASQLVGDMFSVVAGGAVLTG